MALAVVADFLAFGDGLCGFSVELLIEFVDKILGWVVCVGAIDGQARAV